MDQTLRIAEKHFTSNPFDQVSQRDYLAALKRAGHPKFIEIRMQIFHLNLRYTELSETVQKRERAYEQHWKNCSRNCSKTLCNENCYGGWLVRNYHDAKKEFDTWIKNIQIIDGHVWMELTL